MLGVTKKYYVYEATASAGFLRPILVLYVLAQGISYQELGLLSAFLSAVVLLMEVPTGTVADWIGRRNSLLFATVLFLITIVGFLFAGSFWAFLPVYFSRGLAKTFLSGSGTAWLYDALEDHETDATFTTVRGRGRTARKLSLTVTVFLGGILYSIDPAYPFYCTVILNTIGLATIVSFPTNSTTATDSTDSTERPSVRETLRTVHSEVDDRRLRVYLLVLGSLYAVISAANTYIQPLVADAVESGLTDFAVFSLVPVGASLGAFYAISRLFSSVMSLSAGRVESTLGPHRTVTLVTAALAVALFLPTLSVVGTLVLFFVLNGPKSLVRPISESYINANIGSVGRATVLSFVSMLYSAISIPTNLAIGFLSDVVTLSVALAFVGCLTGALAVGWGLFSRSMTTPGKRAPAAD
jgi:MFS family permease